MLKIAPYSQTLISDRTFKPALSLYRVSIFNPKPQVILILIKIKVMCVCSFWNIKSNVLILEINFYVLLILDKKGNFSTAMIFTDLLRLLLLQNILIYLYILSKNCS